MSPLSPAQLVSVMPAAVPPPSWITTTMTSAPWARNCGTSALAVAASSSNRSPTTPAGDTMVGVALSVRPMNPKVIVAPPS